MKYQETLQYLFNRYPVFERSGGLAYKPGLHNVDALLETLGNPHRSFKSIHIAGTNGKGSTSHLLTSVLIESGYKTGLYTSPHLKDFNERIRIGGIPVGHDRIVSFVEKYKSELEKVEASFFEISTAMAFYFFAEENIDIAIVETGMGGRLDATNVLSPELCLITNVGLDHQQFLGNSLREIAGEKAGIIKSGIPVIIGQTNHETHDVFENAASEKDTEIYFAKDYVTAEAYHDGNSLMISANGHHGSVRYECGLHGDYQKHNVPLVLLACSLLIKKGWKISEQQVHDGIKNVQNNAALKGRWQVLQKRPLVICDIAHNEPGWRELLPQFTSLNVKRRFVILGFAADKAIGRVLQLFPDHFIFVFSQADTPRAIPAEELKLLAETEGLSGEVIPNVNDALEYCLNLASEEDAILIAGSNYLIAELRSI